jgi:alpha-beta hydrolase superfamily lysophospholipase
MTQPQLANDRAAGQSEFELISEVDGFRLHGYRWQPASAPEGVVVIAHGAAEHAGRYARFAEALTGQGLETWAIDHRGHGKSPGPKGLGDTGRGGWDGLIADIAQVVREAAQSNPNLPLALFGHSMGAFAAQHFCTKYSDLIDAVVLSGTTSFELPPDMRELPAFDFNAAFVPARTPYDWLSRDNAEVDKYIADPLCGFDVLLPVFSADDLRNLSAAEALANIRSSLPVLLLAGDMDPLNGKLFMLQHLEEKLRKAGIQHIDTQFYEGGRHEMLNEINRDQVITDVIGWLKTTLRGQQEVRQSFIRYSGSGSSNSGFESG